MKSYRLSSNDLAISAGASVSERLVPGNGGGPLPAFAAREAGQPSPHRPVNTRAGIPPGAGSATSGKRRLPPLSQPVGDDAHHRGAVQLSELAGCAIWAAHVPSSATAAQFTCTSWAN